MFYASFLITDLKHLYNILLPLEKKIFADQNDKECIIEPECE